MDNRLAIREGLGLPANARVVLALFESETEHEFCVNLHSLIANCDNLLILPVTPIARRQLYLICGPIIREYNLQIVDDIAVEPAVDEIATFRFNEALLRGRTVPVRIMDGKNRWLTKELAS